jgi:hypothetical protein
MPLELGFADDPLLLHNPEGEGNALPSVNRGEGLLLLLVLVTSPWALASAKVLS